MTPEQVHAGQIRQRRHLQPSEPSLPMTVAGPSHRQRPRRQVQQIEINDALSTRAPSAIVLLRSATAHQRRSLLSKHRVASKLLNYATTSLTADSEKWLDEVDARVAKFFGSD